MQIKKKSHDFQTIDENFRNLFNTVPLMIRSPGRVNLIGEHTDYNDGFVLPAAIDKAITLAIQTNEVGKIRLYAMDMEDSCFETDLRPELKPADRQWANYILGVADQYQKSGLKIGGFDCLFGGDIPIGAGMSSSAALEGGIALGLSGLFNHNITRIEMARIGQKSEHEFVGTKCGIMDQFANLHGRIDHAMLLDCRSLEFKYYPFFQEDIKIVLFNTKIRRELATSEYNNRRAQCEEGVRSLKKADHRINSLRDVTMDLLESVRAELMPVIYKRCKYVIQENSRVIDACNCMLDNNITGFGQNMYASHTGLRDLYEVSCRELDILVDATTGLDGVIGSRMMGGGFGGCTVNLVWEDALDTVTGMITDMYLNKTGIEAGVHIASIGAGTEFLKSGG